MQLKEWGIGKRISHVLKEQSVDYPAYMEALQWGHCPHIWHTIDPPNSSAHPMSPNGSMLARLWELQSSLNFTPIQHITPVHCAPTMHKTWRGSRWHVNWKLDRIWWDLPTSLEQCGKSFENMLDQSTRLAYPTDLFVLCMSQKQGFGPNEDWLAEPQQPEAPKSQENLLPQHWGPDLEQSP